MLQKHTKGLSILDFALLFPLQRHKGSPTPECQVIQIIPETQSASLVDTTTVCDQLNGTRLYCVPVVALGPHCETPLPPGRPPLVSPSFKGLSQDHALIVGPATCDIALD